MTRIGWLPSVFDPAGASPRLRAYRPCSLLAERGWDIEIFSEASAEAYEVVLFQKAYQAEQLEIARKLKARGATLVADLCDNHFYVPSDDPELIGRAERAREMVELADAVVVSTEALAQELSRPPDAVIPDLVDPPPPFSPRRWLEARWRLPRAGRGTLRTVWFGNAGDPKVGHGMEDLAAILPALEEVAASRPVSLTVVSNSRRRARELLAASPVPATFVRWRLASVGHVLAAHDVCLLPIQDNPFTRCKSANRPAFALSLGLPVVADMIPSYEVLRDGLFVGDWARNIERCARRGAEVEERLARGREQVALHFGPRPVAARWESFLRDRLGLAGPR